MLSITLDTAPGEGGEAPVIKRPKSSEQQPLTQARHNQQHSSTSTCLSTVHHFLILRVYPSAPHSGRVFTDSKFLGDGVMDRGAVGGGERTGG